MNGFGQDTDPTGGTRYSEGKVVLTWLPWRGIHRAWNYAEDSELPQPLDRTLGEMVRAADLRLQRSMNDPVSNHKELAACLWWLLQVCHHDVVTRHCPIPSNVDPRDFTVVNPPRYPALGVWEIGRVSCYGAAKYAEFDWNEGQAFSTLLSSARRHVDKALAFGPLAVDSWHGDEPKDTRYSGLLHVAHAGWNIVCLLDFLEQERIHELDDVSVWEGITAAKKQAILEEHRDRYDEGTPDWVIARDWQVGGLV